MNGSDQRWITATEMDELIQTFFGNGLEANGFNRVNKRRWVRSRIPGIRDVFEFVSISHSLNPRWGFSLDFCPEVKGDGLKWHRTEKSAALTSMTPSTKQISAFLPAPAATMSGHRPAQIFFLS